MSSNRMRTLTEHGDESRCGACGYDTRGLTESRCPECGSILGMEARVPPGPFTRVMQALRWTPGLWFLLVLANPTLRNLADRDASFWFKVLALNVTTQLVVWIFAILLIRSGDSTTRGIGVSLLLLAFGMIALNAVFAITEG